MLLVALGACVLVCFIKNKEEKQKSITRARKKPPHVERGRDTAYIGQHEIRSYIRMMARKQYSWLKKNCVAGIG